MINNRELGAPWVIGKYDKEVVGFRIIGRVSGLDVIPAVALACGRDKAHARKIALFIIKAVNDKARKEGLI